MKADFDIGNLLYVVLTILFLVLGAFGKKKKPASVAPESTPDDNDIRSQFQDIFREINPAAEYIREPLYNNVEESNVESGPGLDTLPEDPFESIEEISAGGEPVLDTTHSNYDLAVSSLENIETEEGVSVFSIMKEIQEEDPNDLTSKSYEAETEGNPELALITEGFEARTAFIYSEIFNRKVF